MMPTATSAEPLLRFALDGARARGAATVLEKEAPRLVAALRRAVPFLSRRRVPVELTFARAMPMEELLHSLTAPVFVSHLQTNPGNALGALLVDGGAIAMFVDGVLGGNGAALPSLNPAGLSGPQEALVSGIARNIIQALSATLGGSIAITMAPCSPTAWDSKTQGAPIVCVLAVGDGDQAGRVALLLPREALLAHLGATDAPASLPEDDRIASVVAEVELVLVVELARLPFDLGRVASLRIGDTLRLDVAVTSPVSLRVGDRELMQGRPTNAGGRIGVRICSTSATSAIDSARHEG
jgi:flagellar motor switch protein FliM